MTTTLPRGGSAQGSSFQRMPARPALSPGLNRAAVPLSTAAPFGHSRMSNAFEARIDCQRPERGLFLVIGRGVSPLLAVRSVGGQVAAQLAGGMRLLAVLPVAVASALQRHADVALAGPVTVDAARFAHFTKLAGLDGPAKEKQ